MVVPSGGWPIRPVGRPGRARTRSGSTRSASARTSRTGCEMTAQTGRNDDMSAPHQPCSQQDSASTTDRRRAGRRTKDSNPERPERSDCAMEGNKRYPRAKPPTPRPSGAANPCGASRDGAMVGIFNSKTTTSGHSFLKFSYGLAQLRMSSAWSTVRGRPNPAQPFRCSTPHRPANNMIRAALRETPSARTTTHHDPQHQATRRRRTGRHTPVPSRQASID